MKKIRFFQLFSWVSLFLVVLGTVLVGWLAQRGCSLREPLQYIAFMMLGGGFAILSIFIGRKHPENRIGLLALIISFFISLILMSTSYAECSLSAYTLLPAAPLAAWLSFVVFLPAAVPLFIGLPLVFPNGHFLTPTWRRFGQLSFVLSIPLIVLVATFPGLMIYNGLDLLYPYENPFGLPLLPLAAGPLLNSAIKFFITGGSLVSIVSFIQRWRQATGETRQQLKWFAFFLLTAVALEMIFELISGFINEGVKTAYNGWLHGIVLLVALAGFPTVIGISVFKYRLYDIDIIIRRTLVYSIVTILLGMVYFSSVIFLQRLFAGVTSQQSPVAIVISTLLIAALFTPIRHRIQNLIDRRFYRRKYDAAQTLAQFAATVRDEVALETLSAEILRVVQNTVEPDSLSLWLLNAKKIHK